MLFNLHKIKAS